jgi:hypothetical protein
MGPEFNSHFENFFKVFMQQLQQIIPAGVNIAEAYENGTDDQQAFVQNLALFFTGFFKVGGLPQALMLCLCAAGIRKNQLALLSLQACKAGKGSMHWCTGIGIIS